MGLFGGSTKTYIESSTQRLFEDRKPFIQESLVASVMTNGDFTSDFQANYMDSIVMKGKQVLRYAEKHYPYGLPNGTMHVVRAYDDEVRRVIKSQIGTNVEIIVNLVDTANAELFIRDWLAKSRGYNPDTLVISKPPFTPPDGAVGDVKLKFVRFLTDTSTEVTYVGNQVVDGKTVEYTRLETRILGFTVNTQNPYYHVTYYEIDKNHNRVGDLKYWFYDGTDKTYPSLYLRFGVEPKSLYYPIIPIRMNKVDYTSPDKENTKLYRTSRRILKYYNIDIKQLGQAVHKSPDIKYVDHAYVVMGLDIADSDFTTLTYLHSYFGYLHDISKYTKTDFDYWKNGAKHSVPAYNTISLADATYKMNMTYNYITKEVKKRVIGEIGTVKRSVVFKTEKVGKWYSYDASTYELTKQITAVIQTR